MAIALALMVRHPVAGAVLPELLSPDVLRRRDFEVWRLGLAVASGRDFLESQGLDPYRCADRDEEVADAVSAFAAWRAGRPSDRCYQLLQEFFVAGLAMRAPEADDPERWRLVGA